MSTALKMMKRCSSFSTRPDFPKGLRVLVVDDSASRFDTESLLKECGYSPMMCMSSVEAIQHLLNVSGAPDIMLIEVTLLAQKTPDNAVLLAAAKTLPLVLMAAKICPKEIISGINKQGAVDFIEQPIHLHTLKNIWQHVVRRQMMSGGIENISAIQPSRTSMEVCSAESPSLYSTVGDNSIFSNDSNLLDQADMDLDQEMSSLFDTVELALCSPLAGLSQGFSDLLMGDLPPMPAGTCSKNIGCGNNRAIVRSKGRMSGELRRVQHPLIQHRTALRSGGPILPFATKTAAAVLPTPTTTLPAPAPGPGLAKPAMGHSCGQLPPLGAAPGMAWGLPTNPLHISPKPMPPHMAGMMQPPWMHPMMMPGYPGMMMPPMPGMCSMPPNSMGMLPQPPRPLAGMGMPGMLPVAALAPMLQRAFTSPLPVSPIEPLSASMVHSISLGAPQVCCLEVSDRLGLGSFLNANAPQKSPIGLQLKKSPSLMDMINLTLERAVKGASSIF